MRQKIYNQKERFINISDNVGLHIFKNEVGYADGIYNVTDKQLELVYALVNPTDLAATNSKILPLDGVEYTILKLNNLEDAMDNGTKLIAAWTEALMKSTATGLKHNIIVPPATYHSNLDFIFSGNNVNIISLTGEADIKFTRNVTIDSFNGLFKGLNTYESNKYIRLDDLCTIDTTFINCKGGAESFQTYSGNSSCTFKNCYAGNNSYGYNDSSGYYEDCIGENDCFGSAETSTPHYSSGTYIRCKGNSYCFGNSSTGIYIDCEALEYSFGLVQCDGTYTRCSAGYSFGAMGGAGQLGSAYYCISAYPGSFNIAKKLYCIRDGAAI